MNDCMDGTLCEVGMRREAGTRGAFPAKVVSADALAPQSPSIAPPNLSTIPQPQPPVVVKAEVSLDDSLLTLAQKPSFEQAKATSEAWQHIASNFLPANDFVPKEQEEEELLLYMMDLPRQRHLAVKWANDLHSSPHDIFRALVAMLLQVTGQIGLCNNCRMVTGGYTRYTSHGNCVALPDAPPRYRRALRYACCNCYFFHDGRPCAFAASRNAQDAKSQSAVEHDSNQTPLTESGRSSQQQTDIVRLDTSVSSLPPASAPRHTVAAQDNGTPLSLSPRRMSSVFPESSPEVASGGGETRMVQASSMIATNGMGIEDWEFAPGVRVVESDSGIESRLQTNRL